MTTRWRVSLPFPPNQCLRELRLPALGAAGAGADAACGWGWGWAAGAAIGWALGTALQAQGVEVMGLAGIIVSLIILV
jgi:hypothetical protein